jgi:hypothetical protein
LIKVNAHAGLTERPLPGQSKVICFWLPHSLGTIKNLQDVNRAFDHDYFIRIEDLLFKYSGLQVAPNLRFEDLPANFINARIKGKKF